MGTQWIDEAFEGGPLTPVASGGFGPNFSSSDFIDMDATGVAEGSLLIAFINVRDGDNTIDVVPSGWTEEANINVGGAATDPNLYAYSKIAGASEGVDRWEFTGFAYRSGQIIEIPGASGVDDFVTNGNNDNLGVVTIASGGIALGYLGLCDSGDIGSSEPPSGYAELSDRNGSRRAGGAVAWDTPPTGDTSGSDAFTRNDATNTRATIHLAIS